MLVGVGETPPQCLPRHPHLGDTMSEQDRQDLPPRALAEETAAHAILTRPSREFTGNFCVDEDVLRAEGVTDFSGYQVEPGMELIDDFFV